MMMLLGAGDDFDILLQLPGLLCIQLGKPMLPSACTLIAKLTFEFASKILSHLHFGLALLASVCSCMRTVLCASITPYAIPLPEPESSVALHAFV